MGVFPRGRALPVAVAIAGAVVGSAVAFAAGAAAQATVITGGGVSPTNPVPLTGSKNDRIVNGGEVADDDWVGDHFIVKLLRVTGRTSDGFLVSFVCGGVLFRPNRVITAAHCVNRPDGVVAGDFVEVGGLALQTGVTVRIGAVVTHPDWDPEARIPAADIAVLQLVNAPTTAVYNTVRARKAGINRQVDSPAEGDLLTIAGWGRTTGVGEAPVVGRIRQATVTALDWATCAARSAALGVPMPANQGDTTMCVTGEPTNSSACKGDSGGPVFVRTRSPTGRQTVKVVGISSFVLGTRGDVCPAGGLNFFARVSTLAGWIDSQMEPGWKGWVLAP